jgi:hypothetical protein
MHDIVEWFGIGESTWLWVRHSDGRIMAEVSYNGNGFYRAEWLADGNAAKRMLKDFDCPEDAWSAMEKWWPPHGKDYQAWFESRNGGYFRKFGRTVVYVRQTKDGWFAVRYDGKILGEHRATYFPTAEEAFRAVHKERNTPRDPLDPRRGWRWFLPDEDWKVSFLLGRL